MMDEISQINGNKSILTRIKHLFFGHPRDINDQSLFHRLSLIPFLAWIGLGADGLSSSSYGPEEAFRTLSEHTYLAVGLALFVGFTVVLISSAYSHIIEQFPHGGGGYVVATKLIGTRAGVISGCALIVDYILTITVSIAAAGDALFSFVPPEWHSLKVPLEGVIILTLAGLNIRGVRESVLVLAPIFLLFLLTHILAIGGGIVGHLSEFPATVHTVKTGFSNGLATLGVGGLFLIFIHAYSMGGGTYTGIEAVSNGLPIMREPRIATAKKTMLYMATSLSITAAGLIFCYLLWKVAYVPGKTMNAVFLENLTQNIPYGRFFVITTLVTEGALLIVAAQAGFIDGPRVLANMAIDHWFPHRFSALSERFTTSNGVVLMCLASVVALLYTQGNVVNLVVMYSINVFLTFSLSMFGMSRFWFRSRSSNNKWIKKLLLFSTGLILCGTILVITIIEKFGEGGWITLTATGTLIFVCFAVRKHYGIVGEKLNKLYSNLLEAPVPKDLKEQMKPPVLPGHVAAVLVSGYSGFGIHTVQNIFKTFPAQFDKIVFLSVAVIDSGGFKGKDSVEELQQRTRQTLEKYVAIAKQLEIPVSYEYAIGTDVVQEAEKLCIKVASSHERVTFFSGKVVFPSEGWYHKILHNDAALAIQKRLQWIGLTMVVMPVKVIT